MHARTDQMDFDDGPADPVAAMAWPANSARFVPPPHTFESARPVNGHRAPPSDADAEENLIAALFVDAADVLERCAESAITESSFTQRRLAAVFAAALDLHGQKQPVDIATLAHVLRDCEAFDGEPVITALMWMEGKATTTAHVRLFAKAVRGAELLRRAHEAAIQSMEEVFKCAAEDAAEMLEGQQARLKRIADSSSSPQDLMDRAFNPAKLVPRPPPVYTIADIGVCTRGNLTTIYAQSKAGKSSFTGAMMAATMLTGTASADTLGVKGPNYASQAVLHFDTEQSTYDWQALVLSIVRRAGLKEPPKWFMSFSLAGMEAAKAERFVHAALRIAQKRCGGIHSVFVDGVADLVSSPNNEDDSNALVARLHGAAIEHDCSIINILHLNPASKDKTDKGRGHLGSQLERKSESNLTLKKEGDVTVLMAEGRQRGRPIPTDKAPAFQWSEEHAMHRSVARPDSDSKSPASKTGRKQKYEFAAFRDCFPKFNEAPQPITVVHRKADTISGIKIQTFRDLVMRAHQSGLLDRSETAQGFVFRLADHPPVGAEASV